MLIALSRYNNEALIALADALLVETHVATLGAIPKVAPWVGDVRTAVSLVKETSEAPAPAEAEGEDTASMSSLDDLADNGVRTVFRLLNTSISHARSKGEGARADRLAQVRDAIFDRGMAFIRASYLAQPGGVARLLELARGEDVADDVRGLAVNGESFEALLERLDAHNARMQAAVRVRGEQREGEDGAVPRPLRPHAVRMQLINRLNHLFDNLVFSIEEGEAPDLDRANAVLSVRKRFDASIDADDRA